METKSEMKSVGRETVQITKTLEKAFTRQESQVSCGSFLGELAKVSLARGLENKPSSRDWMAEEPLGQIIMEEGELLLLDYFGLQIIRHLEGNSPVASRGI